QHAECYEDHPPGVQCHDVTTSVPALNDAARGIGAMGRIDRGAALEDARVVMPADRIDESRIDAALDQVVEREDGRLEPGVLVDEAAHRAAEFEVGALWRHIPGPVCIFDALHL